MFKKFATPLVLCWLILCGQIVLAQVTTARISGTARDETTAVLPGATVTVKNLDRGITRVVITDDEGRYHVPNLALGNYELQVELPGFQIAIRSGLKLTLGREAIVDFTLQVGEITDRVVVTGEATLVELTSSAISGLVDDKKIRDLPLNGRSFEQLTRLQLGVILGKRHTSRGFSGGFTPVMSIAGARPQQSSFLLDGTDVNDYRNVSPGGAAGVFMGVETVREFKVLTNSYSAEYGRAAGGVISVVTKSGTNEFHGNLFAFHRNSALDARNFFDRDPSRPEVRSDPPGFKRNQFGFTAGGPIKENQSFFFGSYEGLRERLGVTQTGNVPLRDASDLDTIRFTDDGTTITAVPEVRPYLVLYPLPNGRDFGDGTAEFISATSESADEDYMVIKIDHNFSDNHSFFARYTFDDSEKAEPEALPAFSSLSNSRRQYVTVEEQSVLSPTLLNVFRLGFNRTFDEELSVTHDVPAELDWVPGVSLLTGGELDVDSLETLGQGRRPRWAAYNLYEWTDALGYTRGRNSVKAGLNIKMMRLNSDSSTETGGTYNFGSLSDFLDGTAAETFFVQIPGFTQHRNWRQWFYGFYVQDDLTLRPNLTLNLGLRVEFMTSPNDGSGRCANVSNVMMDTTRVGCPLFETSKDNFMPRFGFAWDPSGQGKMAIRGGFGLFYDQPFPTYWASPGRDQPPFTLRAGLEDPSFPDAFEQIDPDNPEAGNIRSLNYTGTTYAMQYTLTVQRQIASDTVVVLGYAGSQGRKLFRTGQMNIPIPEIIDGRKFFPKDSEKRNPNWLRLRIQHTDANSNYNALLASVNKRFSRGFQFQGSYTLSKVMSHAETVRGADFASGNVETMDPYDLGRDRSLAEFDTRQNFVFNYTYELPGNNLQGIGGKIMGGWQTSGILSLASGAPFTANSRRSNTGERKRPDLAAGASNNPVLGGPDQYFDPLAFEAPGRGFYGNLGRNTLIDPGVATFDFSLIKNIYLPGESSQVQFRTEFFNLFNRANFQTPEFEVFDRGGDRPGAAGNIDETTTTSRQIQFALKIIF